MNWLLPRLLASLAGLAGGGLIGLLAGAAPLLGALLGVVLAGIVVALRDAVHGYRLLRWLRGAQQEPAPRDTGFWGELGYRIERGVRAREQRIADERARLSQFLSAIEASPNGVLLLDADDRIEWCNVRAAQHFGIDPQRDRRQRVTNLLRVPAFVAHLQSGHYEQPVAFREPRGGAQLTLLVRRYGSAMKLVLSQDTTEQERADTMRRDFVANVSHEIRTPLTVLAGFLETMDSLVLSDAERTRMLALMRQQTDRMARLVGDLLTLARLEGGPRPPVDQWVLLAPLLAQLKDDAELLSAGRHSLVFADPGDAAVAGAESELQSAAANLIHNAIRYTPDGGRIEVGWKVGHDGSGELAVRDNGPGIAREHLPRLAERFYRVDSSRSRATGGTGLGLAIAKHVVQRHGGELQIDSQPGRGSTFSLVLPAPRVRPASVEVPIVASPA